MAVGLQNKVDSPNLGSIVSVRGGVVDVRFDCRLPPIFSVLHTGADGKIIVEVMAQLDATRVRGIALTPTEGLARVGSPEVRLLWQSDLRIERILRISG